MSDAGGILMWFGRSEHGWGGSTPQRDGGVDTAVVGAVEALAVEPGVAFATWLTG